MIRDERPHFSYALSRDDVVWCSQNTNTLVESPLIQSVVLDDLLQSDIQATHRLLVCLILRLL